MPQVTSSEATRRVGTYRSCVFVGRSYHREQRLRQAGFKSEIAKLGYVPVVADDVQLENDGDIHHATMILLHSCRLAVFELSQLSGALMEIKRVPAYGIQALVLFAAPSSQEYLPSRMLSSFLVDIDAKGWIRMTYKVWDDATIRSGTAQEILQEIVNKPTINLEIIGMNVDQYAGCSYQKCTISFAENVLEELYRRNFSTIYDKALSLLSVMPANSARILTMDLD